LDYIVVRYFEIVRIMSRLVNPREQVTLQLIIKWLKEGLSHCAITKSLNKKNIKPRKAKEWSQPTVGFIIKRRQENNP